METDNSRHHSDWSQCPPLAVSTRLLLALFGKWGLPPKQPLEVTGQDGVSHRA